MKITKRTDNETSRLPVTQTAPLHSIRSMHDAMDRLFGDHFLSPFSRFGLESVSDMNAMSPRVDISETDKDIKVRAEIPGIDPKDIQIEVTQDSLTLSGKVEKSLEEKQENYYRMERSYGHFSREFMLPAKIDADSVHAEAKNGVVQSHLRSYHQSRSGKWKSNRNY